MGLFSRFEHKMEDTFEGMSNAPISPVQIAKKAEKQMRRGKMVGAGKQYAPTLYTVLVNPDDDQRLFGYYPTLAGETETYLAAKAAEEGLVMDGQPLVRFIVDDGLRHGKFEIIAEAVSAPIIAQLRAEEMQRYGLAGPAQGAYGAPAQQSGYGPYGASRHAAPASAPAPQAKPPLPYVPEEELDRSIDYGEYTFDSHDFEGGDQGGDAASAGAAADAVAAVGYHNAAGAAPAVAPQTMVFPAGAVQASQNPPQRVPHARLVNTATNQSYALTSLRVQVGRESRNTIALPDINASRVHAELRCDQQGTWTVTDLGSTNGTFVNDRRVSSCALSEGDRLTIGTTSLLFTLR